MSRDLIRILVLAMLLLILKMWVDLTLVTPRELLMDDSRTTSLTYVSGVFDRDLLTSILVYSS